ncbi:MAG: hypothetical protein ACI97P_000856, partial [Arcticibacterium sp.]
PVVLRVTSNPQNVQICPGDNALFSVIAEGQGLSYRWQVSTGTAFTSLSNGSVYEGVTSANLNLSIPPANLNGNQYRCIVSGTNLCGLVADTSAVANLSFGTTSRAQTILYSTPISTDNGLTQAISTITGTNKILQPNGKATYQAGNAILLDPGFEVESGAFFKAVIKNPCEATSSTTSNLTNDNQKEKVN